jgi:hypothetical protein
MAACDLPVFGKAVPSCTLAASLAQAETLEERIVDFARHGQTLVSLIASHGRSRFEAKIATIVSYVPPFIALLR